MKIKGHNGYILRKPTIFCNLSDVSSQIRMQCTIDKIHYVCCMAKVIP